MAMIRDDTGLDGGAEPGRRFGAFGALLTLFALSGVAALVYQVLWLKQLTRLFGVNAHATSVTLAIFFLGLAAGGWVWGRRVATMRRPLRVYAWLELGIALGALLFFGLFDLFRAVQIPLLEAVGHDPVSALGVKFLLALVILFPSAFFMGGTLPVMAQFLVRQRDQLGSKTTVLYAVNTVGAAIGALLAGFVLPQALGLNGAYSVAIGINVLVFAITAWWSRGSADDAPVAQTPDDGVTPAAEALSFGVVRALAAFSGAATLALEVLWTRMLSQVMQNSVYTFAIILTVFLAALSLGSALANRLCARSSSPRRTLVDLLAASGVAVIASPVVFQLGAEGLEFWDSGLGFWPYVGVAFLGTVATIGPAVLIMGAVFPFLMKVSEPTMSSAGRTVGELASVNTVFAILGSLAAGFFLLGTLGLGTSIAVIAASYFAVAAGLSDSTSSRRRLGYGFGAVVAIVVAASVDFEAIRISSEDARNETVVESWQGPDAAVSVTKSPDGFLRLRINSSYNLGSSGSAVNERIQGQLPGLLHEDPRSIFFIGLGTGITASGAMHFPYERVVVCELNPDVVDASRRHFGPWLEGLFESPKVRVVPEDGRIWLSTRRDTYDVIAADIFLSYKAGVGALYTREHFETVRERLNVGGVFVQWFGAFDTSDEEFATLAATMLDVFPSVTLWRRSFSAVFPVYALVGRMDETPLDVDRLEGGLQRLVDEGHLDGRIWLPNIPLAAYVANLSLVGDRFADAPRNTDDRTVMEYSAPVTERESKGAGTENVLAWGHLLRFCEELHRAVPPEDDPYLANATPAQLRQVRAGTAYYGYEVMRRTGREAEAAEYLRAYQSYLTP